MIPVLILTRQIVAGLVLVEVILVAPLLQIVEEVEVQQVVLRVVGVLTEVAMVPMECTPYMME